MNKIIKLMKSEAFKYLVIGGCTTLVNLVAYAIFVKGLKWDVTLSNILSISISILFAYVTNKLIVFQSHCANWMGVVNECAKFVMARLATMVIEVGGVFLTVNMLGQDAMVGKLETQVIVIVGNYFISKFLVFKD